MALVLANGLVAGLAPRTLERRHIGIEAGRIAWVSEDMPDGEHDRIDITGRIVISGNVCAHTHAYSALARGMPGPLVAPRNFVEILERIWWRLDRALDAPSIRSSALVAALDAVRAGTTCLVDHHASPNCIEGSLDLLADAFSEVGLRGVLCYEVTDRGGKERREAGLRENQRFIRENRRPLLSGMVGAHASFTLEDETLIELSALADEVDRGVHIHVAEDRADEEDALRRSGKRAAERLDSAGILRAPSIVAHGVWLDSAELETVHRRRSWLVHNCRSNLNNGVGRASIARFGDRAALGTDGIDEDMFAESRTAFFRAREDSLEASADRFVELLSAGAELASEHFARPLGRIEPGYSADLVVLRYDPPTPLTPENLAWHWMFALTPANVESVMVNGEWSLQNGDFCRVDEEKIRAEASEEAKSVWERMSRL